MSEVQTRKKNEISANMFETDAGQGIANITQEDLALPFLKVLGQLSPEVNKRNAKYVEGAEPGMIINTVTNEIFDGEKGIDVVPVYYKRQHIEWQDRGESQGAPVKIYEAGDDLPKTSRDKFNKDRLANGNYLENTASHFVVVLGKNPTTALISMKATQLKVSRKWNSMMMGLKMQGKNGMFTPPTYSHIYKLKLYNSLMTRVHGLVGMFLKLDQSLIRVFIQSPRTLVIALLKEMSRLNTKLKRLENKE